MKAAVLLFMAACRLSAGESASAALMGRDDLACSDTELCGVELLITLGGDGTILSASRIAAPLGIPVLGVHMGRFGFIAEAHPDPAAGDRHPGELAHGRIRRDAVHAFQRRRPNTRRVPGRVRRAHRIGRPRRAGRGE